MPVDSAVDKLGSGRLIVVDIRGKHL